MINLRNFSLGMEKVTVERYTGTYTNGVFTRELDSSFDIWASVQPYSTVEQDLMVDPSTGQWVGEIRQMFCEEKLYMNDKDNPNNLVRDKVIAGGVEWEPFKIEPWQHLSNKHYLVLLKKWDGD